MPLETLIRATLAAAVACSLVLPSYAYADKAVQIEIPAGDLDRALESLARQAEINLVYQPAEMQGVKTNGVNATLTPREAVVQLLSGTSLRLNTDEATGAMMISRSDATDSSIRLAQAAPPASSAATSGAQTATSSSDSNTLEEVIVTGYIMSLEEAATAKRNSVNFTDSVFAEDIGKFPDLNLAESLQRMPGVQIDRDTSGEGTYINVRGLSAGFTVLTINSLPINTSSNGGNDGRGSSLDILPSELFRRLTLSKSPMANTVEGGTAGVVDLQPVRAFDRQGPHLNVQLQDSYQDIAGNHTPRGALLASNTFDTGIGGIGVLVGAAYAEKDYRSEIFNTVGYTTMNLGRACPSNTPGCNSLVLAGTAANPAPGYGGGAGSTLTVTPANVPPELGLPAAGQPLVQCGNGVPGGTSGLSCQDLSHVIVPRLVRAEQIEGKRDRKTGMVNLEWRPTDTLSFTFDSIVTESNNKFGQYDVMMVVRNYNNNIPVNFQVNDANVLTSGTFANTYFLNQSTDTSTYTKFFYRALTAGWDITENLHLSAQGMLNDGEFRNVFAQYTLQSAPGQSATNATPLNTGQYATYSYTPGDMVPYLSSNIDLATYTGWYWNGITIIPTTQDLDQDAERIDLAWGDAEKLQLSAGVMRSNFVRHIATWNVGDCAFRGACGNAYAVVPEHPSALTVVPNSALPGYLVPLPSMNLFEGTPFNVGYSTGWLVPDFERLRKDLHIDYFTRELNPGTHSTNYLNTYSPRILEEETLAGYLMANGRVQLFGNELRYNVGGRYTETTSTVAGIVNDYLLIGGAGTRNTQYSSSKSHDFLPSMNVAYLLTDSLVLRGSAAKTQTRPNPQDLAPTYGLSLDGDRFTKGNPGLDPFYAYNYDIGVEWYPTSKGFVTLNVWMKDIFNYPAQIQGVQSFPETGLDFTRLSERQRTGITNLGNGDPNAAQINVIQKQNSDLVIHLLGEEFQWNQPLDFLFAGFGFNANVTHIEQTLSGQVPSGTNTKSLLAGLAPWTYNGTLYYQRPNGFSVRLSYTHRDENLSTVCPCNNINGDIYAIASDYMDAQLSFLVPGFRGARVTLQAQNLLEQVQLNRYRGLESQADGATYAGRTFVIGLSANF